MEVKLLHLGLDQLRYSHVARLLIRTVAPMITCLALSILFLSCSQSSEKSRKENQLVDVYLANGQTVAALLQLTIDATELQGFLHPGEPGRDTLYLVGRNLPDDLSLTKDGNPVEIAKTSEEGKNCLVVNSISVSDTLAIVNISYPIEGLRGEFSFKFSKNKWVLQESDITEI